MHLSVHGESAWESSRAGSRGVFCSPWKRELGAGDLALAMKHNPGISIEWEAEEQAILDHGLSEKIARGGRTKTTCQGKAKRKSDDGISYKAVGGPIGELLEQNAQAFNQISANLAGVQIQENINLFCQARDNILKIMNDPR